LFKRTFTFGSNTLYDVLYKLNLDNLYVETIMTLHHNIDTKHSLVDEQSAYLRHNVWTYFQRKNANISK